MEKKAWMTLLLDFYGPLLTEHQRRAVELSCGEDYSLAEIAEARHQPPGRARYADARRKSLAGAGG
ncbi:MAG: hypothetical protein ACLUO4_00775 [Christensenellales bacterium]